MRRTAGAAVDIADLNYAYVLRQLKLAAVFEVCELLRVREPYAHRDVGADGLVRALLDVHELIPVKLTAEVYGHALGTHVEADIIIAVLAVDKPGDDVFTRVVLHTAQALFGVKTAGNGQPRLERSVGIVQYLAAALLHIGDAHGADIPRVGKLPAALGEEGCPIKSHCPAALFPAAIEHLGFKGKHMAVDIIKLFGRHLHCSCLHCSMDKEYHPPAAQSRLLCNKNTLLPTH